MYSKKIQNWQQGYVSIVVLILMMVLVTATYFYASSLFSELTIARNNKGAAVAFSLAEAGVQEAIYLVQYDPDIRERFMTTTDGLTIFSHETALIPQGGYEVRIQNNAWGSAIVTAIGTYHIGTLRTARREIKVGIAQANDRTYPYDGGIYATGSGAGSSIADSDFWYAPVNIYNGGVLSNRDINFKFGSIINVEKTVEAGDQVVNKNSTVNCNCLFEDDSDPETPQCGDNPGCAPLEGAETKKIPEIDFEYYKNIAKNIPGESPEGNQYFAKQKDFKDLIPKLGSHTFSGVVFIDGPLDIDWARTITMNGIIAASGSITITLGQLFVNVPAGGPAGVLSSRDIVIGTAGNFQGTGLVYAGDRVEIDSSIPYILNLTGGIIARRVWISGFRTVNIHFDSDIVNTALDNPTETPVIEINHWEEEY